MLTSLQMTALRTAIFADTLVALPLLQAGNDVGLQAHLNSTSDFVVYRTDVTASELGNAWDGADIEGMSSLNMQRLQLLLASSPEGVFDMTREDRRIGFLRPFGSASTDNSNASKVAMQDNWKRFTTVAEKILTGGVGTVAAPSAATWVGWVTPSEAAQLIWNDSGVMYTQP